MTKTALEQMRKKCIDELIELDRSGTVSSEDGYRVTKRLEMIDRQLRELHDDSNRGQGGVMVQAKEKVYWRGKDTDDMTKEEVKEAFLDCHYQMERLYEMVHEALTGHYRDDTDIRG